jgi:hypothetical protein
VLVVDLRYAVPVENIADWVNTNSIETLNVADPRESQQPGIHERVVTFLTEFLTAET